MEYTPAYVENDFKTIVFLSISDQNLFHVYGNIMERLLLNNVHIILRRKNYNNLRQI